MDDDQSIETGTCLRDDVRARLRAISNLTLRDDEESTSAASRDFGGLLRGQSLAVARPETPDALQALVRRATEAGLHLTPRGLGLSQSGQSIAARGLSVEMGAFDGIEIDPRRAVAHCGSAVTWRELLSRTRPYGLVPTVMPLNLDLSIGGTLSAGGMGSTSHRHGMAVSSVEALTVVTGAGELVSADRHERPDIHGAVLGGVGQFGFICSAVLRLRPFQPVTRTYYLLYDDVATLLADERKLMAEPWCTHLEGFASASIQGLRRAPGGRRAPFARWFYGLHVSTEFSEGAEPSEARCLAGLGYRERLHVEDNETGEFPARYALRFEMMKATGAWGQKHPWFECLLPYDVAIESIPRILERLPLFLGDGHRIMPVADGSRPDLLMHPVGAPVIGFGVLTAGVPDLFAEPALQALKAMHDEVIALGGKRYLSGWLFEPGEEDWRRHYGEAFELWRTRKAELDPAGILSSVLRPSPADLTRQQ